MRLRPDQANASYLVQALGQPISLLANTRIITPDVPGRQTSDSAKRAPRLDDGSVLVFETGKVNRNRLPVTLPKPFDGMTASGSPAKFISARHQDLRNLGQHPFWSSSDPFDASSSRTYSPASIASLPLAEVPDVLDVESDSEVDSDSLATNSQDAGDSPNDESITGRDDSSDETQSKRVPIASLSNTEEPIDAEPAQFSIVLLLIIFLVFGAFVVLTLGFNRIQTISATNSTLTTNQISTGNEAPVATPIAFLEATAHSRVTQLVEDEPSILAMDEHRDRHETITIPIRPGSDFGSRREAVTPPTPGNNADPEHQSDTERETASTPLARALLQLEQRRSA